MNRHTALSPIGRTIPVEGALFYVTVSNLSSIRPTSLAIAREGRSFRLSAAYDASGHSLPLELTINQVIPPGDLSGACTKLLLTRRLSGDLFGTVSIGMFMAAVPEVINDPF